MVNNAAPNQGRTGGKKQTYMPSHVAPEPREYTSLMSTMALSPSQVLALKRVPPGGRKDLDVLEQRQSGYADEA